MYLIVDVVCAGAGGLERGGALGGGGAESESDGEGDREHEGESVVEHLELADVGDFTPDRSGECLCVLGVGDLHDVFGLVAHEGLEAHIRRDLVHRKETHLGDHR